MNTEAFWVTFSTPYPRRNVLSANQAQAVPSLASPPRRTVETFRARVSSFLALDCEETTLAASFHSVCCRAVFPSPTPTGKRFWRLRFPRAGFSGAGPAAPGAEAPAQAPSRAPPLAFLSLGLVLIRSSWFETWNNPAGRWGQAGGGWQRASHRFHFGLSQFTVFFTYFLLQLC